MSLEELWQLFPIYLTAHQACWNEWYLLEEASLQSSLPTVERISHIGSTAIPSIWAKPIIDVLVEIPRDKKMTEYKEAIITNGYLCMSENEESMSFNKGYRADGFADKVFHLHLRYLGNNKELYFRDYLLDHPNIAKEYEQCKLALWKKYEHDRDGYTNAKTPFIREYTDKAKALYKNKY